MSLPLTIGAALAAAATSLVLGNLGHRVLAPLPAPDPTTFPRAGDRFGSRAEGVVQEVHAVTDGWIVGTATLAPGAKGPPLHTHDGFAETFTPTRGTLHVEVAGRVVQLRPGESLRVAPGVPHRLFNPGGTEVVLSSAGPLMPQSFAAALVQLYRVVDERGSAPLTMLLQMSVFDPIFDTQLAGPPRLMQQALSFALAPAARLAGFRNYYAEYALHAPAPTGLAA
jgi:mannose-6-phosphate isomerase-like protein (cupin superfamily)